MLTVTATDLPRLMNCNGSRLMEGSTPSVEPDDTVKQEGIAAHWLVQQVHAGNFSAEELVDRRAPNGVFITPEMVEYLSEYLEAVAGSEIEVDTSFSGKVWEIRGRADSIKYNPDTYHLTIPDLKYGFGIVEPEKNWTLIWHAIGWMIANPEKTTATISFVIYQPRANHPAGRVREWSIDNRDLMDLYVNIDETLSNPSDILNTGKHCYKCPHITVCPASRAAELNAIDASEKAFNFEIDNQTLSFMLDHYERALNVLNQGKAALDDVALHRIRSGQIVENYTVETAKTNRLWKDFVTVDFVHGMTGLELTKKRELVTPKQAENAGVSKEFVSSLTERRDKGAKLIRMSANTKAKKIFNTKEGN